MPVQWIDMNHMKKDKNRAYFGEALDLVEQFGIEELLTFHMDFDPEIVAQFFASVHFHTDEKRSMTWMTNGKRMTAEWKEFMDMLHIHDEGLDVPVGIRLHATQGLLPRTSFNPTLLRRLYPMARSLTWTT